MALPLIAPYNISFSAWRTAQQCERRAALAGPGAWQGWSGGTRSGDPLTALCYRGKNLHDLPAYLGQSLHRIAERVVRSVAFTGRCPSAADLYDDTLVPMRDLWTRTRREFEQHPKSGYMRWKYMGEARSDTDTEVVPRRTRTAVSRLRNAALLDDLRVLDRADRVRTEELLDLPMLIEGFPPATLFGKADAVYTEPHALHTESSFIAPGERGIPVIVDFKSGRVRMEEAVLQLSIIALLLRAHGVEPHPAAGFVGRVVNLSEHATDDEQLLLIGDTEMAAAEAWVQDAHRRIAAWPRDEQGMVRLAEVPATYGAHCTRCPMRKACHAVDALEEGRAAA